MKFTFCICLFIVIFISEIQAANEDDEDNSDSDKNKDTAFEKTLEISALAAGHPEIAAAIELIKNFKRDSSLIIGERQEQSGFLTVTNNYDHSSGSVLETNLDKLVSLWLDDDIFSYLTNKHKQILAKSIKEYELSLKLDPYQKKRFELSFNDGQGHLFMMLLYLSPHESVENALRWSKFLLQSSFQVAPPYVIVTESKCRFMGCKRQDKIVYLPATLNKEHINTLIDLNMNMLNEFTNNLEMIGN